MNNAEVVCRQIGCGEAVATLPVALFGPGTGEIVLDDIQCQGNEQYLWNCRNNGWLSHNCQHSEDVAVNCSGYSLNTPTAAIDTESSTGYGSCRYNCGGYSSGCSCDYNCPYYGNCCPDFCDHCSYINNVIIGDTRIITSAPPLQVQIKPLQESSGSLGAMLNRRQK
ncbi:deleted in malignant brain tumors 1 protein-like [Heptranchias perlo]|uniref:deleted in malignant brain tumors 1 protein-like n=1 Tax=Heptranchias perlo TaxID=212740 RepID=UPI0035597548